MSHSAPRLTFPSFLRLISGGGATEPDRTAVRPRRAGSHMVLVAAAGLVVAGCTTTAPTLVTQEPAKVAPESRIDGYSLALVIHKSQQTLSVYERGIIVQQFDAVVGQRSSGDKLYEGDLRTPEGLYRIDRKREHGRWKYFLDLDYPNGADRRRYQRNLDEGRIPKIRGRSLPIGGGIGIHGTDRPGEQNRRRNWTKGCIALANDDIAEIHSLVKVGTPVLVLP